MNATPPPGWYPDNTGHGQRYWDGRQWTQHTQLAAAPRSQGSAPLQGPPTTSRAHWFLRHKIFSGVASAFLLLVVVGAVVGDSDEPVSAASETRTATDPGVAPAADPEPEPVDSDGDGVPDDEDFRADDPEVQTEGDVDTDGDGVSDDRDYRPDDRKVQTRDDVDTDGDRVPDYKDDFPRNAQYSRDADGDGVADQVDDFPQDKRYSQDLDGDRVADSEDDFPADPTRWRITPAMQNAIGTAQSYLDYTAFSRSGLIDQLEYEGYKTADATFAVDHLRVNWNQQAFKSAQSYLDYTSFSLAGLIDQLQYEGFTYEQAAYGARRAY